MKKGSLLLGKIRGLRKDPSVESLIVQHMQGIDDDDDMDDASVAIQALANALTEMNQELRLKTSECDALHETVTTLAVSLHETDERLNQVLLENERLTLKLQSVCFLEKGDDVRTLDSPRKKKKNGLTVKRDPVEEAALAVANADSINKAAMRRQEKRRVTLQQITPVVEDVEKIVVSDNDGKDGDQDDSSDEDEGREPPPNGDDTSQNTTKDPPMGPSIQQSEFVRLIRERDDAQKHARNFQKEVLFRRKQAKQLQGQLSKLQQMVELVYQDNSHDPANSKKSRRKWKNGSESSVQWLPSRNRKGKYQRHDEEEEERNDMEARSIKESTMYMEPFRDTSRRDTSQLASF
jgi:hypothetical protein